MNYCMMRAAIFYVRENKYTYQLILAQTAYKNTSSLSNSANNA